MVIAQINCSFSTHCIVGSVFENRIEHIPFLPKDTLFIPIELKRNENKTIYYDVIKKTIATQITFDTINQIINYKHYNRNNKLVKEQIIRNYGYPKDYNTNPLKKKLSDVESIKTYLNDSLVFEAKNEKGLLKCYYSNPKTKTYYEKRVYEDCEYTKEFDENKQLKSICILSFSEEQLMDNGDGIIELIEDCTYFDEKGTIIGN